MLHTAIAGVYHNSATALNYIATNDVGPDIMWNYLNQLTSQVVNGATNFNQFVLPMVKYWSTPDKLLQVNLYRALPVDTLHKQMFYHFKLWR
jgi:hypothetical protein